MILFLQQFRKDLVDLAHKKGQPLDKLSITFAHLIELIDGWVKEAEDPELTATKLLKKR